MSFTGVDFSTILVKGDLFSHYFNIETLETNANFSSWQLNLYFAIGETGIGARAYTNVFTLTKDIISGSDYRFYIDTQVVPFDIDPGCYRMAVLDTVGAEILYITEIVEVRENTTGLLRCRFRNDENIMNYNYETLTTFKNRVNLPLKIRQPKIVPTSEGYDLSAGTFNQTRVTLVKEWEFITGWIDKDAIEAFHAMFIHSTFEVELERGSGVYTAFRKGESAELEQDWGDDYPLVTTLIRLQEIDFATTNRT